MKGIYLLGLIVLGFVFTTNAQTLIAVQNGGTPRFYSILQEAITNAQNGDTIYISGGSFEAITLSKKLHLIGVGHHPDSTNVTAKTIIKGLNISSGSDGSSISGISFATSSIVFSADNHDFIITRCNIGYISRSNGIITNLSLIENIITSVNLTGFINANINNNVFSGQVSYSNENTFKNNLFLFYNPNNLYPYSLNSATNCLFENNIFNYVTTNLFTNCIIRSNINYPSNNSLSDGNQGVGNFTVQASLQSVFEYYDPTSTLNGESIYKADFHLKTDSPYKNAGRDGTDIGIYGGAFPWKEGSVPSNPHFQRVQISPKTDNNGNLNVKIKVAAQDR